MVLDEMALMDEELGRGVASQFMQRRRKMYGSIVEEESGEEDGRFQVQLGWQVIWILWESGW